MQSLIEVSLYIEPIKQIPAGADPLRESAQFPPSSVQTPGASGRRRESYFPVGRV